MLASAMRILSAGKEHRIAQAQVEANRAIQAANNRSQLSLVDSKKIVQTANNAASRTFADARRSVQSANNSAETTVTAAQRRLQEGANALSASRTAAARAGQEAYNGFSRARSDTARQLQATANTGARNRMAGALAVQKTFNDEAIKVAEAKRVLQAARNERAAVDADVARWTVSLSNRQRTEEFGLVANSIQEQLNATLTGATSGRAYDRIAYAEAMGSSVATAAALGIGGSAVDDYNNAMGLRQALKEEREDRELRARVRYSDQQAMAAMRSAYNGMGSLGISAEMDREVIIAEQDNTAIMDESNYEAILNEQNFSVILDEQDYGPVYNNQDYTAITADEDFEVFTPDLDYTVYMDHKKMSGFQQVATFVGAGVATYFGGPAAGQAVMDASIGINDMQNGNFAGAQRNFSNSQQNASTGWKTFRAGSTTGGTGQAWGANFFGRGGSSSYTSDLGTVNYGASLKI